MRARLADADFFSAAKSSLVRFSPFSEPEWRACSSFFRDFLYVHFARLPSRYVYAIRGVLRADFYRFSFSSSSAACVAMRALRVVRPPSCPLLLLSIAMTFSSQR